MPSDLHQYLRDLRELKDAEDKLEKMKLEEPTEPQPDTRFDQFMLSVIVFCVVAWIAFYAIKPQHSDLSTQKNYTELN